ncbi:hypothetical protein ACEPAG_433 [Sanghuangporus baumii]
MSEYTSLLQNGHRPGPYARFSPAQKKFIAFIACLTGLIPLFVSGSFVPSIPQIVIDLHSTARIINPAVGLSIFTVSCTSLLWATYSSYYGRRPIYLVSLPILCLGSLGVGCSQSVPGLMAFRVVQAFGSSVGMTVGTGVIADIYGLEERGTAMGIFLAAALIGPALAPLAGGIAAHYYTWRHMHYAILTFGLSVFFLVLFFLPETSHPGERGIEKANPNSRGLVWLNPFRSLWLLQSPNLLAITYAGTVTLLTDYVLLIPLAYTIGVRYNITNEALVGACFLPNGLGNLIGAPLAGRISDKILVKWRKRRHGVWVPEDRLRGTMVGGAIMVPMSILSSGITTRYVSGRIGVVLNLIFLFFNGLGVDFVLSPSTAYSVDIMHSRSAEAMASTTGVRGMLLALATTAILPFIESLGVLYTDTIAASLALSGSLVMWMLINYGDRMRAWKDMGYSTIESA